jgi:hypothetical protein
VVADVELRDVVDVGQSEHHARQADE